MVHIIGATNKSGRVYADRAVFENCYKFLEKPVIVTSGESITPMFFNGENFMQDGDGYKNFEMNPVEMMTYANQKYHDSEVFKKIIDISVEYMQQFNFDIISGGRTRDWPFSAMIAKQLGLPFLALMKDIDFKKGFKNQLINTFDGRLIDVFNVVDSNVGHAVDLVTSASSVVKDKYGWIDQVREMGGNIEHIYAFIDRNQKAEENIAKLGAQLHSLVRIDNDWLDKYDSEHKEIISSYLKDPEGWSMRYMVENGIQFLAQYLDGSWTKDDRLIKLMRHNKERLKDDNLTGKIISLANAKGYKTHNGKFEGDLERAIEEQIIAA